MLTKQTAIERLRTTGTLATAGARGPQIAIREHVSTPIARDVSKLLLNNARVSGRRHVAPTASQAVLP